MTKETHKTISLSEFAERALHGEAIEQELTTGERVDVRVHTPDQGALLAVRKIMIKIVKVADTARKEADIDDADATLAYELGLSALAACVRDDDGQPLPGAVIVDLFSKLPYKSDVMVRCQELCGVTMISVPPLDDAAAIEVLQVEAESIATEAKAAAQPNRKQRRAAKSGGKRSKSDNIHQMRDEKERDYTKHPV